MKKIFKKLNFSKTQSYLLYLFVLILPLKTVFILREVFFGREKWHYGTISLYLSDIVLTLFLILIFFTSYKKLLEYFKKNKTLTTLSFLFILYIFFSISYSLDKALAFYFSIKILLAFCLFFVLQITKFNTKTLYITLIISTLFQSIIGLFQFITQSTFSFKYLGLNHYDVWRGGTSIITSETGRWLRSYGGQNHPNILAILLLTSTIISIYIFVSFAKEKKYLFNSFLLLCITFFYTTILFTFSRNIWLALFISTIFISIFLFFYSQKFLKKLFSIIILIFFTSLTIVSIYKDLFFVRINHDTFKSHNSISDRKLYITQAKTLINKHTLLGTGAGNYTNSIFNLENRKLAIWQYQPVHNFYLLVFAELGFIGGFLLLLFIFNVLLKIFYLKNKITFEQFTIFLVLILFLFTSLLDHFLWTSHIGLFLLFLFLGLFVKSTASKN